MTLVLERFETYRADFAELTRLWRSVSHPNVLHPSASGEVAQWATAPSIFDVPYRELGLTSPAATVSFVRSIASATAACQAAGLSGSLHTWLVLWDGTKPVLSQVFSSPGGERQDVRELIAIAAYAARGKPTPRLRELLDHERYRRRLTVADFAELPDP